MAYPDVALVKALERAIRRGHPWIYRRALDRAVLACAPGEIIRICRKGRGVALAYAQPNEAIGARVLALESATVIDGGWIAGRIRRALALRSYAGCARTADAYRLIHGENDGLPGLVVDRYAGVAVVAIDGAGAWAFWQRYVDVLIDELSASQPWSAIIARAVRGTGVGEQLLAGSMPAAPIVIREGPARFGVDVRRGQKTGFFLDQRDNRAFVARFAAGARVLNLFAYTGGFSVHAALAGARQVTTLDQAKPAVAAAQDNFALNDLPVRSHEFVSADAFDYLEAADRRRFDVVVCDPPSFAPSAKSVPRAINAYTRLNELVLGVVASGGLLATASCSSHITTPMLADIVAHAATRARRHARIIAVRGAGPDHPTLPAFPEGNYLSFLLVAVD